MIESSYSSSEDIVYVKRSGEVLLQDIINNVIKLDTEFGHFERLFILDDVRGTITYHNTVDELRLIADEVAARIHKYKYLKVALVVDDPSQTALSYIYEQLLEGLPNYSFKVFSTFESAKAWLKIR